MTNKKAFKKFEKFLKNQSKQGLERYHHCRPQRQLQHQCLQHPLQPLHHLQHHAEYLHQDRQNPPWLEDTRLQQPMLHYTQLEPPPGPVWVDMDQKEEEGPEHDPVQPENAGEEPGGPAEEPEGKRTDALAFGGGGSAS